MYTEIILSAIDSDTSFEFLSLKSNYKNDKYYSNGGQIYRPQLEINKRYRKQKCQSRMDIPQTQSILNSTQYGRKIKKKKQKQNKKQNTTHKTKMISNKNPTKKHGGEPMCS